jgi:hypothetical protein
VCDLARFEHEFAWAGLQHPVAKENADTPFEDVRILVFVPVGVHRRAECSWWQRVFDEAEPATGLFTVDHEPHAQLQQLDGVAVRRSKDHLDLLSIHIM